MSSEVLIFVFGDIGHSPRIKNHAREFIESGFKVTIVGYLDSDLPKDLVQKGLKVKALPRLNVLPADFNMIFRLLDIIIRIMIHSVLMLFNFALVNPSPKIILVQNPPSLPTLLIAPLLARWHRSLYVIDWHNLGFTILAQRLASPTVISLAKFVEILLGKWGDINLCVSRAERDWLRLNGGINSLVLYDRPSPNLFKQLAKNDRFQFRRQIRDQLALEQETDKDPIPLLLSSTSWTPDEDFPLLFDALVRLDSMLTRTIHVVVTGKGPLKEDFEKKITSARLRNVQFKTCWLPFEQYASLLGSADLGICLHSSSSGLDLPMKLIDMIGAKLPTVAKDYSAIRELINGAAVETCLFNDAEELAQKLQRVINEELHIQMPTLESFHDHWQKVLFPLLPAK